MQVYRFLWRKEIVNMTDKNRGYRELEHTADWSIEVWAPDMVGLLKEAATGMYALVQIEIEAQDEITREFSLDASDKVTLMVDYLSELLYLGETDHLAFNEFDLSLDDAQLLATVRGGRITSQTKEIKAVTYHDLNIQVTDSSLRTKIVFDV
jgi:SHS2 domain-containing protein